MRAATAARESARKALLEAGFDLDVGGTSVASAESQTHAVKRNKTRRVPDYDAFSDPHLLNFWRTQKSATRRISLDSRPASASRRPVSPRSRSVSPTRTPGGITDICAPASADHVLALKRVFFRFSEEFRGNMCKAEACIAQTAGVSRETARVASVTNCDILGVVKFGIGVSNHFRKLAHQPPLSSAVTDEVLRKWLHILGNAAVVDWPSFLLLSTADLISDLAAAVKLHEAFLAFSVTRPIRSESDFADLLSFLYYTNQGHEAKLPTFFQSGDCYKARHSCNFAEIMFSLMPHQAQFYLSKANARGYTLSSNNCGHASIGVTTAKDAPKSPPRRVQSASVRSGPVGLLSDSKNSRKEALRGMAKQLRYQNRVFV